MSGGSEIGPLEFAQSNGGQEQIWVHRTRYGEQKSVKLKSYDVFASVDGERVRLGVVEQRLATHERKPQGSRIVTRRWRSPRWFYQVHQRSDTYCRLWRDTRGGAAADLVDQWRREHKALP